MIEISHLHKYFNKGRSNEIHVIDDVTVSLPEKGIVAIFGRSGCGKTTLLNVIGGLDSYLRGSVMVQGEEVSSHSDTLRNRDMGYIFQNYNLLKNESCFDNVAYALRLAGLSDPEEIKARVDTALSFVDMAQYARRTPDTLSGGQQQRVAIARAIVKNPRIILADEPTGNLDEVNTVKVMDLLREIARDCLVLLVTHEADLVDYYCDTVIELSDGKVVDVRHNTITDGYAVRDKNTVYLGELDRDTVTSDAVSLSYYGAKPSVPIAIKVVNYGGKTYLSVDTPGVQVLDADSEMKLKEGVFVRHEVEAQKEKHVDMSRLPRVQGQRLGRLFTFKNAALSGYRANFGRQKKGKKMLKSCLALFAAVIVFMTAIFGTAIGEIETIRAANNPNVFYVRTDSEATSILLNDPENQKENGIDQVYVRSNYTTRDDTVVFSTGFFETSENSDYNGDFSTHGVFLSASLAEKLPLLAGTKELKEEGDLLLSAATADMLLEKSTVSYLSDYEDLIGLSSLRGYYDMRYRIVGIVDTNESAFYLSPLSLAKLMLGTRYLNIKAASQVGIACEAGSVVYLSQQYDPASTDALKIGDSVSILGASFTLSEIRSSTDYESFLQRKGIKKLTLDEHVAQKLFEKYPSLTVESPEYFELHSQVYETEYAPWFLDYYDQLKEYCREESFFRSSFESWLYLEKDIPDLYLGYFHYDLYRIHMYRELYGKLPTVSELNTFEPNKDSGVYYERYEAEFRREPTVWNDLTFVVNDADYITLSAKYGKSHAAVDPYSEESYKAPSYTVVHTSDPEKTAAYLQAHFEGKIDGEAILVTPDTLFDEMYADIRLTVIAGLSAMGVILGVMSICMFFIMRSALMNRIREVGILRAIGVTRKNLIYRFMVETAVLITMTVLVGYLLSSGFIFLCHSASSMMSEIFYYPVWLAGAVLAILVLLSMLCGLIPIQRLLRKSPSAILAKYDI